MATFEVDRRFSCSHKGLIKQALTGTGTKYKNMGLELQKRYPRHDGDVGSAVLACFFHVAPWPVGSPSKAIANAKKAARRPGGVETMPVGFAFAVPSKMTTFVFQRCKDHRTRASSSPSPVGAAQVQRGGPTLRNLYYVAVISYGQGDYETAAAYFQRALDAKPGSPSEADFAPFMKSESKRSLALAQEKLAKA